jgi:hypothetical protein
MIRRTGAHVRTQLARVLTPVALSMLAATSAAAACTGPAAVCPSADASAFPLIAAGRPAAVSVDPGDFPGVVRAAKDLQADLGRVAGAPSTLETAQPSAGPVVIVGALGRSAVVDRLVREGRLDVRGVRGRWEAFVQQVVDHPAPGIDRALVIAGADKRGTIFGIYDLDERMGVSPWAWWADVPVARRADAYVTAGARVQAPKVKYRGLFLNDEDPSLGGWVKATYGGFNHRFYERVFELILRMKGDLLWPAMWGDRAFADDDPENAKLADEMGVVISTSHHEPMMRAHDEWRRYGQGPWDYTKNAERLRDFWRKGIERMGTNESLVTIGMRGDGDEPMTQGTAIPLLERIVGDQRKIIGEVTGKDPSQTPQVWALYKEVQAYYDQGMRVPDDVTLLFSDDNWGNIRRLPDPNAAPRSGGYGVYYHFDYVGGPRNYKWINTNQIERTWEQMHLAYAYGARQLWIVNVGDLKPMELPIQFFLDDAWDPDAMPVERMAGYSKAWAQEQFGPAHAAEIAGLLDGYTRLNARRKPELLSPDTFSLLNYREAERVENEWEALAEKARKLRAELPTAYDDAFEELVAYPVEASANLNRLYLTVAHNRLWAEQGRTAANRAADEAKRLFARDAELSHRYEAAAHGKWAHMMDQTHIGYTGWQQPKVDVMPAVRTIPVPAGAAMGVAVEGDARAWPQAGGEAALPRFDRCGAPSRFIEVFDRGSEPVRFAIEGAPAWVRLSEARKVEGGSRIEVSVDWSKAPAGRSRARLLVRGSDGTQVPVVVEADNPTAAPPAGAFVDADGYVAIEAEHFSRAVGGEGTRWGVVPGLGRTLSGVTSFPVTAPADAPGAGPRLEYRVWTARAGEMKLEVITAPTLDFRGKGGLRFAVSIDDGPLQLVDIDTSASQADWSRAVADNARVVATSARIAAPGLHTIKLWRVDPGVVFERVVLDTGGLRPSYLGPPESLERPAA